MPLLLVFFGTARAPGVFRSQNSPHLRESLGQPPKTARLSLALVIFLLTWVSVDILQAILLYFIKYVVQREDQSDLIMATIFVTAMIVLPFWEWASRRWNKRLAYAWRDRLLGGGADL